METTIPGGAKESLLKIAGLLWRMKLVDPNTFLDLVSRPRYIS